MVRVTSDLWVAALLRSVRAKGGFAYLRHRGAAEAGAIFILVYNKPDDVDIYAPAPQSFYGHGIASDRLFIRVAKGTSQFRATEFIAGELRFDTDIFLIDIEDYGNETLPFSVVGDPL